MAFSTWLTQWLKTHPLKAPSDAGRRAYTAQVMRRVTAVPAAARSPLAVFARWLAAPQPAFAFAAAAAGIAVAVWVAQAPSRELARAISRDDQWLTAAGETVQGAGELPETPAEVTVLAEELATLDTMVLAEAPESDETWLQETLQLLDQLEEETPADASGDSSSGGSEDWIQELQTLDESEFAAKS
jgi:hypothetical protein